MSRLRVLALGLLMGVTAASLGGCTVMSDLGRFEEFRDIDAGPPDAGSRPDAGPPDAGADASAEDAGPVDGSVDDGGLTDSGFTTADSGM